MGMPPASRMASLLALLSAARFWSVATARVAVFFSGLAATCVHAGSSGTLLQHSQLCGLGCQLHILDGTQGRPSMQQPRSPTLMQRLLEGTEELATAAWLFVGLRSAAPSTACSQR